MASVNEASGTGKTCCHVNGVNSSGKECDLSNGVNGAAPQEHPSQVLRRKAAESGYDVTSTEFAALMDAEDPLRHLRAEFHYPLNKHLPETDLAVADGEQDCVYLCGNSLGLLPRRTEKIVTAELDKWAKMGVYGHLRGDMPWAHCDECCLDDMAKLVGASSDEIALMNGLTVNEHLLLISFYRPTPKRHKILMESHSFPSDHYCVESQIRQRGFDPATSMICLEARGGEETLRTEDVIRRVEEEGASLAVVLLPGVQYYTGQVFDMAAITEVAHKQGCYVGFDLAHAVGNIELELHDWDVDFACWCTYKYVNTGAGGMAGIFIHDRFRDNDFPKLSGWWSHRMDTRFKMDNKLELSPGAAGYRISNPPIMTAACLRGSLDVFNMTSMRALTAKSRLLTGYLELLILQCYPRRGESTQPEQDADRPSVDIITPADPTRRGAQLSLVFSLNISRVASELRRRGAVLDKREPHVLRVAPAPLYNSFTDVLRFVRLLQEALDSARTESSSSTS